MNNYLTLSTPAAILSGLILITGCSSDDGGSSTPSATVPANATVIDASNAEAMIAAMASSLSTFDTALAVEATPIMGLNAALDKIKPLLKNRSNNSGIDLATGVAFDDSGACSNEGGTYSIVGDETDNGTTYSETVTATFNNCDQGPGLIIDGTLSGTFTENYDTGAYTDNVSGSLSITLVQNTDTIKISFTGLSFQENGNNINNTYTTAKATFALVVEVNGTVNAGFLSTLSAPIVESTGDSCPESGHITITGANSTNAEGIFNGDNTTMTIKANGTVVNASASCYS